MGSREQHDPRHPSRCKRKTDKSECPSQNRLGSLSGRCKNVSCHLLNSTGSRFDLRPGIHSLLNGPRVQAGCHRFWTPPRYKTTLLSFSISLSQRGNPPTRTYWQCPSHLRTPHGHPLCPLSGRYPTSLSQYRYRLGLREEVSTSGHRHRLDGVLRHFIRTPHLSPQSPKKARVPDLMRHTHQALRCLKGGGRHRQDQALIIQTPFTTKRSWRRGQFTGMMMPRKVGW